MNDAVIESVSLMEIPHSRKYYLRPYDVSVSVENLNDLEASIVDSRNRGNMAINPADIPAGLIMPTATPTKDVPIPGTWEATRYTFIIKVMEDNAAIQSRIEHYITGYTEETELSYAGSVDPNMIMYINNVMQIVGRKRLYDINTILHTHAETNIGASDENITYLRIYDTIPSELIEQGDYTGGLTIQANRMSVLDRGGRAISAEETVGTNFISSAVNIWLQQVLATMTAEHIETNTYDPDSIIDVGQYRKAPTDMLSSIQVLKPSGAYNYISNSITYAQLVSKDPSVPQKTIISDYLEQPESNFIMPENCESWKASTQEAVIATIISEQMPSIMLSSGLITAGVIFTNMTTDGEPFHLNITFPVTFGSLDASIFSTIFRNRLIKEVIPSITQNNTIPVSFTATLSLVAPSTAIIQINGPVGPESTPFNLPTFNTGMHSSVLLPSMSYHHRLRQELGTLREVVQDTATSAFQQQPEVFYG